MTPSMNKRLSTYPALPPVLHADLRGASFRWCVLAPITSARFSREAGHSIDQARMNANRRGRS